MNFESVANEIIDSLKKNGVECYLYHAATTGSAYIRFNDARIGSIRLGDHKGRSQYSYKWNVRSDFPIRHSRWHNVNNKWRYYAHIDKWRDIIPLIIETQRTVRSRGINTVEYFTPTHKLKKNARKQ